MLKNERERLLKTASCQQRAFHVRLSFVLNFAFGPRVNGRASVSFSCSLALRRLPYSIEVKFGRSFIPSLSFNMPSATSKDYDHIPPCEGSRRLHAAWKSDLCMISCKELIHYRCLKNWIIQENYVSLHAPFALS